jgi:hypothetical protein
MIFSDTIIEGNRVFLRNLVTNASTEWSTPSSSYNFYNVPYEINLGIGRKYYVGYTYKFTTTNQSPTWVLFYSQDGVATWGSGARINNPVAGTVYTRTSISEPSVNGNIPLNYGTIYNGDSNAIQGVLAQAKEVFVYDITN